MMMMMRMFNGYNDGCYRWFALSMYLSLMLNRIQSQEIFQSYFVLSDTGTRFLPNNIPAQFIRLIIVDSWRSCAIECNNNPLCRVFDYGAIQANGCLLFEGDVGISGSIIPSNIPDSMAGMIEMTSNLFTGYGQACSSTCGESRYLVCSDKSTCECMPHTYWDSSAGICYAQITTAGASCDPSKKTCREDYNLTCSAMNKCVVIDEESPTPTPPVIIDNTIADRNTVIQGSSSVGLEYPLGLTVYDGIDGPSLLVADSMKNEIIHMTNIDSNDRNITVLIHNWSGGSASLNIPSYLFLDTNHANNLYVTDSSNQRVVRFASMQVTSPLPKVVAGTTGSSGSTSDRFVIPYGVVVDSEQNLYVADHYNHRIMFWANDATSGTMIAGTGIEGAGSMELNYPIGLFLNEVNSLLYVADKGNHRVQVFHLIGTPPYNGSTIAGGNGPGSGSNQLYEPSAVWVSKKTNAIYISDSSNHRIQRWDFEATIGVTIAGDPNGNPGTDHTRLSTPTGITINKNETRMYVSDTGNGRIQWFDL